MAELETKTIHSVAKAIRLLDLLAERTKPATLTELYQATGWPKSTIHGLLSTMREAGLIEQTPNGRYWLGIRLFEYGCAVSNAWDIGSIARNVSHIERTIKAVFQQHALRKRALERHVAGLFIAFVRDAVNDRVLVVGNAPLRRHKEENQHIQRDQYTRNRQQRLAALFVSFLRHQFGDSAKRGSHFHSVPLGLET